MTLNRREFLAVRPLAAAAADAWPASLSASQAQPGAIDWRALRAQLTLEPDLAHLNWGTYSHSPRNVAMIEKRDRKAMQANCNRYFSFHFPAAAIVPVADRIAGFLGVDKDELARVSGATKAINVIAAGLPFEPGDEIMTTELKHQAGITSGILQQGEQK